MFNVYEVRPGGYYYGIALVAANSAEDANEHIRKFKDGDPFNVCCSHGYEPVNEDDKLADLHSNVEGVVYRGIYCMR